MRERIGERLRRCKLELHPGKTLVACTDPQNRNAEIRQFDFLGFTFRPRVARSKAGVIFLSFGPAISTKAAKGLRQIVRRTWRLPRRTTMSLDELANMVNPALRGWMQYYGRFRPSELGSAFRNINLSLRLWVMRKYKRFKRRPRAAMAWLGRIAQIKPVLFAHWEIASLALRPAAGR